MASRQINLTWEVPAYATECEFTQGEALLLQFTRDSGVTIATWTIACYIKKYHDDATVTLTLAGTLVSRGTTGIFTLPLTAAQTLAFEEQTYVAQVWRIDAASETLMSSLALNVLEGQ